MLLGGIGAACYQPWTPSLAPPAEVWRAHREGQGALVRDLQGGAAEGTLDAEAVAELAVAASPELKALRAQVRLAEAAIGQAGEVRNPSLRITEIQLDDAIAGDPRIEIGMRFPIPRPGVAEARHDAARHTVSARQAELAAAERRVRAAAAALYAEIALASLEAEVADAQVKARARQREILEERLAQGHGTRLALAEARLEHAEAADRAGELRVRIFQAMDELARRTGVARGGLRLAPLEAPFDRLAPDEETEDQAVERALAERPELARAQARVLEAGARVHVAESARYPWFDFAEVGYEIRRDPHPAAFAFALGIEIPLFSWSTGSIAAQRAEVGLREVEREATVLEIAREVQSAASRVRTTWARLEEVKGRLLPAAEAALEVAREARVVGSIDELALLEAEHRWLEARRRLVQSVAAYEKARMALAATR